MLQLRPGAAKSMGGEAPMSEINALLNETLESSPAPDSQVRIQQDIHNLGAVRHPACWYLDLRLPASRSEKFLMFTSCQVWGILWQWPECTKTLGWAISSFIFNGRSLAYTSHGVIMNSTVGKHSLELAQVLLQYNSTNSTAGLPWRINTLHRSPIPFLSSMPEPHRCFWRDRS